MQDHKSARLIVIYGFGRMGDKFDSIKPPSKLADILIGIG
jgi:hypothetical protein